MPVVGQALAAVGGTALCDGNPQCGIAAVAALNSAEAGVTSGRLGDAFKAGVIAYGEAEAFNVVGQATGGDLNPDGTFGPGHVSPNSYFLSGPHLENIVGHALVGCAAGAASGSGCGPGAFSAGLGATAAPGVVQLGFAGGFVAESVIGGVGSVAGGGKFLNGASTAGFGYLFNQAATAVLAAPIAGTGAAAAGALSLPLALSGDSAPDTEDEIVTRYMSIAELDATLETGLIRGGRSGPNFVTDDAYMDPDLAQRMLALAQRPEVMVEMSVPRNVFSPSAIVEPNNGQPGGGTERQATGQIPVRVLDYFHFKK